MGWYSAVLVFETEIEGAHDPSPLQEESIRIFRADSPAHAAERAVEIGQEKELSYKNSDGQTVFWKFRRVLEVQDLCEAEIYDGVEVFYRMWRVDGEPED